MISCRSEEHTSELQSLRHIVCRLLLEKKKTRELTAEASKTAGYAHMTLLEDSQAALYSWIQKSGGAWRKEVKFCYIFFFNDTATTEIYTLSLHDALPISIVADHGTDAVGHSGAQPLGKAGGDRKSTRLNSSHLGISYAVFCLKKKKN